MRIGILLYYIFAFSAAVDYISRYSLGPNGYIEAGGEPLFNTGEIYLLDNSNDYQDFDLGSLIMPGGADEEELPELSQGDDAAGAMQHDLVNGTCCI